MSKQVITLDKLELEKIEAAQKAISDFASAVKILIPAIVDLNRSLENLRIILEGIDESRPDIPPTR